MGLSFRPLTDETLPAAKELLLPFWERTMWDDSLADRILRWRFLERRHGEAILAMDGDRCVAMLDSALRPYMVNGERREVRETADWYSLPEYRGAGLQPIWTMMKKPQPIVSIGGSAATRSILPRLGWKPLADGARDFALRLTSGMLLEGPIKRLGLPGEATLLRLVHKLSVPLGRVRRERIPGEQASVKRVDAADCPTDAHAASEYSLARLVSRSEIEWLQAAPPEMGECVALAFSISGTPVGLSLARLFSQGSRREATILHVQAAEASADSYGWIVSETSDRLSQLGAAQIRCRTTCSRLAEALRRTGFRQYDVITPLWLSRDGSVPSGTALLSYLRADDGILPYPRIAARR